MPPVKAMSQAMNEAVERNRSAIAYRLKKMLPECDIADARIRYERTPDPLRYNCYVNESEKPLFAARVKVKQLQPFIEIIFPNN
jgi:hypothetical protein